MSTNGAPREGSTWQFSGTIPCRSSGQHGFAVRVLPRHGDLGNPYEPGLVTWGRAESEPAPAALAPAAGPSCARRGPGPVPP